MTSKVTIEAYCASNKEVEVGVFDNLVLVEGFVLKDGQTAERSFYDNRTITVRERYAASSLLPRTQSA